MIFKWKEKHLEKVQLYKLKFLEMTKTKLKYQTQIINAN